ncbi:uncharacterized protein LOC111258340 [Setaria italica]|uniref:uncharacterized protein LOC111258340 n=1 Tax=Setaria italica TaxID=4555 RepID=UPI000BE54354|nr:uncharacterized protein LOC111258340 [Setaria italica]
MEDGRLIVDLELTLDIVELPQVLVDVVRWVPLLVRAGLDVVESGDGRERDVGAGDGVDEVQVGGLVGGDQPAVAGAEKGPVGQRHQGEGDLKRGAGGRAVERGGAGGEGVAGVEMARGLPRRRGVQPQALNPLTGAQVDLPLVTGLHHVEPCPDGRHGRPAYNLYEKELGPDTPSVCTAWELRVFIYHRVFLSCSPSAGAGCVVLLMHKQRGEMSYARIGDGRWALITANETVPSGGGYGCAAYNDNDGMWWGDLPPRKKKAGNQKLVEISSSDLHGHALFLGFNNPIFVSTKDFPGLRPNCAYLTDDDWEQLCINMYGCRDVGIWNLETEKFESLIGDVQSVHPWLNWPSPICWITTSLS